MTKTFKAFIIVIIIETPSYLLKINKRTNKNILAVAILKSIFIIISTFMEDVF